MSAAISAYPESDSAAVTMSPVEAFPWPVSLGISGVSLGALLSISIFIIRSIVKGDLVPRQSHEREVAAANARADDFKEAAKDALAARDAEGKAHGQTRDMLHLALESASVTKVFMQDMLPKRTEASYGLPPSPGELEGQRS